MFKTSTTNKVHVFKNNKIQVFHKDLQETIQMTDFSKIEF